MKYKTYDENETIGSIFFFIFSTILLIFIAVLFAWLTVPRVKYDPMWYKDGIFYLLFWLFYFAVQMSFYKSFKIAASDFSERPFLDYFKFFHIEEIITAKKCKNREESEQNTEGEIRIYQKR